MAIIYNSDLTNNIVKSIKGSTARDKMPNEIAEKVLPVIDVNPYPQRVITVVESASATNAVSGTIYTTPTNQDFYLTSVSLGYTKDATSTSTYSRVSLYINGAQKVILGQNTITLTAQSGFMVLPLPIPLKVDRNTTITVENSTNVANITSRGMITGFILDG